MFMALMADECGLPRAWGRAETRESAEKEAERQLGKYITKKRELGEPLSRDDFKLSTFELDEDGNPIGEPLGN